MVSQFGEGWEEIGGGAGGVLPCRTSAGSQSSEWLWRQDPSPASGDKCLKREHSKASEVTKGNKGGQGNDTVEAFESILCTVL